MTKTVTLPPLWLLIFCIAIGPLTMTIILPANTQIMRDFATEYGVAQLVLTAYLVAMAISQPFTGYLSDRLGRRPVMLAGLVVFCIGCLVACFAPTLEVLLISRVIQGIGTSTAQSLARAVVRDVLPRDKSARAFGYISMAMVTVPMAGPLAGGFLTENSSWRAVFGLLAVVGVIVTVLVFWRLNETAVHSLRARPRFLPSTVMLLRQPVFNSYILIMTCATGMFFSYMAAAPYLILEVLQRPPTEYGLYVMITGLGYFLGNYCSARFVERTGSDALISFALIPIAVGLIGLAVLAGMYHPLVLFLPMALLTFSNGLTLPNALAGALSVKPELAGTASGLGGFIQVGTGALLTVTAGFTQNGTMWPLIVLLLVCGLGTAVGVIVLRRSAPEQP